MKKIFINNLLITLIFFLFFEIFLRSFGLSDLRGHGKELIEKQKNTETVVFGKKVYLDKYGYRVPSIKYEYNNKLEKIIFIGDSVLFGSGMNEENTFIGKFRKSKKKYSFVNAAIVGNDIEQIYLDVKKNQKLFDANTFFIILTLDDMLSAEKIDNSSQKNINKNFIQKLKQSAFLNKLNFYLRSKSYTYMWIKGVVTKPSERYFVETLNYYNDKNKVIFFEKKINEIYILSKSKKLNIKFVLLPYEYQVRNFCNNNILAPQKKIIEILKVNNNDFIDLTKEFCDYKEGKELYLNFDPVHLSIKGHELVHKHLSSEIN